MKEEDTVFFKLFYYSYLLFFIITLVIVLIIPFIFYLIFYLISYPFTCHHEWVQGDNDDHVCTKCGEVHKMTTEEWRNSLPYRRLRNDDLKRLNKLRTIQLNRNYPIADFQSNDSDGQSDNEKD